MRSVGTQRLFQRLNTAIVNARCNRFDGYVFILADLRSTEYLVLPTRRAIRAGSPETTVVNETETRTELFSALQSLSEVAIEMRGGQLMAAVGELCADIHGRGLWDATEAELLEAVWQFRRNFEASMTNPSRTGV